MRKIMDKFLYKNPHRAGCIRDMETTLGLINCAFKKYSIKVLKKLFSLREPCILLQHYLSKVRILEYENFYPLLETLAENTLNSEKKPDRQSEVDLEDLLCG
uniref:Uncharacterized protein n=1 Tax=Euplotes harpa TaxID=151035 RepID=A0A7S3NBY2_9SPIT|mmetsp:Transcript_34422/g.39810  ORF Transcript_34422/g.39810 Transcript_34422/m.39810 type:complete len:102 (+) Transcript_34422:405-710(+)